MKKCILAIFLVLFAALSCEGQDYLLQQQSYKSAPSSLAFSPDGQLLLTGFMDGSFRVLAPESFLSSLEVTAAHDKSIVAMDMPPKMDFIMSAGGKMIKVWGMDGKHKGNFSAHATTIWNVDISPDGSYAVSSAFNRTFLLWDVYEGNIAAHMRGHDDIVLSVCFSPDGRFIASGGKDLEIWIWDLETRKVSYRLHGPTQDILKLLFSPDGTKLAAASLDKGIRIYDLESRSLIHVLKGHGKPVRELAFSPCSRYLVSGGEEQLIILWDLVKGERIHSFTGGGDAVLDLSFHPDGTSFYSASKSGELSRWALDPELFVRRYFEEAYLEELAADPLFEARKKGESKKEYEARMLSAAEKRDSLTARYYQRYLEERDQ